LLTNSEMKNITSTPVKRVGGVEVGIANQVSEVSCCHLLFPSGKSLQALGAWARSRWHAPNLSRKVFPVDFPPLFPMFKVSGFDRPYRIRPP